MNLEQLENEMSLETSRLDSKTKESLEKISQNITKKFKIHRLIPDSLQNRIIYAILEQIVERAGSDYIPVLEAIVDWLINGKGIDLDGYKGNTE